VNGQGNCGNAQENRENRVKIESFDCVPAFRKISIFGQKIAAEKKKSAGHTKENAGATKNRSAVRFGNLFCFCSSILYLSVLSVYVLTVCTTSGTQLFTLSGTTLCKKNFFKKNSCPAIATFFCAGAIRKITVRPKSESGILGSSFILRESTECGGICKIKAQWKKRKKEKKEH
jgi:hypothetical protein